MMLIVGLRFGSQGAVGTFWNVYMDDALGASTVLIGALVAAGQLLSVPAALAAAPLGGRWGNGRMVVWGSLGMAFSLLPVALVPHWAAAGLGYLGTMAMMNVSTGPIRIYSQEIVAPRWRALMSGTLLAGTGLVASAVSLIGGYAVAALGYASVFLAGAVLPAAAALIFWTCFRVPRGELALGAGVEDSG
jgi:predicted MFS family arabinose efflux permease